MDPAEVDPGPQPLLRLKPGHGALLLWLHATSALSSGAQSQLLTSVTFQ